MIRPWIGLALLSASWLLGLDYYQPKSWPAWTVVIVLGAVLLAGHPVRLPPKRQIGLALLPFVVGAWFLAWPSRAAFLLVAVGLALQLVPAVRRWPAPLGWGTVKAGLVLLAQSVAIEVYMAGTARCHDLPGPLPSLVGAVASLLGIDAAVDGNTVALHSMERVHRLGATWELLLDPATLGFLVGGLVLLGLNAAGTNDRRDRWVRWLKRIGLFALVIVLWLPVRAGLLMAILVDRALLADPYSRPTVMNQFFSPWMYLLFLSGPVLLAWWFVRMSAGAESNLAEENGPAENNDRNPWRYRAALSLTFVGVAVVSFLIQWDPIGRPKSGRVMVVERHSDWEPTDRPYDTNNFGHDPSYSYTRIYDYSAQFYEMSRLPESDSIDDATLRRCDVLVIKIPTEPYTTKEVEAVVRFVRSGGGLLLIGDHTNVFHSSTYLNRIARRFGFTFRPDVTFRIGSPFVELQHWSGMCHPILQHVPSMHFAGASTIDPGWSLGRAAVQRTGLWSLPAYYHDEDTFYPRAEYRPQMRYGAFIHLWATRHGKGRVLAFSDSTIFSNFSTFEPGKPELMLGMLQWLNHQSVFDNGWVQLLVTVPLLLLGFGALAAAAVLIWGRRDTWLVLLAAGVFGWIVASGVLVAARRSAMPRLSASRPMVRVVLDRTVSEVPLSRGGFTEDDGLGYGLLEQWIPRLGYYTTRKSGLGAFSGDLLMVISPTRSVSPEFRQRLIEYVNSGGKLLVFDSPDSVGTTANSLLWPFGLAVYHETDAEGELRLADDNWPGIPLQATCKVAGGKPFMWVGETPVATRTTFGKGAVMAVGFGSLMNDAGMGMNWMTDPGQYELTVYDLLFTLVRSLVEDRPVVAPPPRPFVAEEGITEEAGSEK